MVLNSGLAQPIIRSQTARTRGSISAWNNIYVASSRPFQASGLNGSIFAEFWYNTSWHSALNQSPFQVLYGHSPRQLGIDASSTCSVDSLDEWMQKKSEMQALIQHHLSRAKNRMKMQADKKRT